MLLLSLFIFSTIQISLQIDVPDWQTRVLEGECLTAGTGRIPLQDDCSKYAICENNRLKSVEQCPTDSQSSLVSMFSVHHRRCVPTAFAHCQTMYALCPTLNGSRILQRVEDIDSSEPEVEDFVGLRGDKPTDTEEEILSIFFSLDGGSNAVPFPTLVEQKSFECPQASGLFPLSENESRDFIVCLDYMAYKAQCEADEKFDAKEKECISNAQEAREYSGCRGMPDGVYSLPDSCARFQVCCGDYGYVSRCPLGFRFDDSTAHCVLSHHSQCSI